MQTSSMEISHLKALIKEKMHHTYIENFVQTPQLDEDKLYILTSILDNTNLSRHKKESYIVTAMLVQMALDTHDSVPNLNETAPNGNAEKSKQLSVLAGDYYSGLYYLLLAELEEVNMIQVLATAITDINECKMQLYYKDLDSIDTFISIYKKLDSLLISRIAAHTGETVISGIAEEWLIARKLLTVKDSSTCSGLRKIFGSWCDQITINDDEAAMKAMDLSIHKEILRIEKSLTHFPAHLSAISSYIHHTLGTTPPINSSIAEEG